LFFSPKRAIICLFTISLCSSFIFSVSDFSFRSSSDSTRTIDGGGDFEREGEEEEEEKAGGDEGLSNLSEECESLLVGDRELRRELPSLSAEPMLRRLLSGEGSLEEGLRSPGIDIINLSYTLIN